MTDLDDLPIRLRAQMHAATAADVAPADLLDRVRRAGARRRLRHAAGGVVLAAAAVLAVLALPTTTPPSSPDRLAGAPTSDVQLSLVRGDSGRLTVAVDVPGGRRVERVELPGYVRNVGPTTVTVLETTVPGTALEAQSGPQVLVPGGRQPLALVRVVDCDAAPSLPSPLDLRVRVRSPQGETTVLLPLPEEVVALYRENHACSAGRRAADDAEARARGAAEQAAADQAAREAGGAGR